MDFWKKRFFTFSFSLIRDETGRVGGLFHPVTETTPAMLAERPTRAMRELAARSAKAKTVDEASEIIVQVLGDCVLDLPFFLLFLFEDGRSTPRLAASLGIPGEIADAWPLPAMPEESEARIEDVESRLAGCARGPYPETPRQTAVLPIPGLGVHRAAGVLIAAISPRLPLNDAYRAFHDLLASHVATAVASARRYEEERQKAEKLAELDRAKTHFFSNVSHEFRTPLALMLSPLEDLMTRHAGETALGDELALIHRNGLRLQKLVNTLLDFRGSRPDGCRRCSSPPTSAN
jgi:GAF domain-containing protein